MLRNAPARTHWRFDCMFDCMSFVVGTNHPPPRKLFFSFSSVINTVSTTYGLNANVRTPRQKVYSLIEITNIETLMELFGFFPHKRSKFQVYFWNCLARKQHDLNGMRVPPQKYSFGVLGSFCDHDLGHKKHI